MKYKNLMIAVVGVLAVLFGWTMEYQEEIINQILVPVGMLLMLQDTVQQAWEKFRNA